MAQGVVMRGRCSAVLVRSAGLSRACRRRCQVLGLPFGPSYQVISWLCWVPNLLLVERFVVGEVRAVPVRVETESA